MCGICCYVSKTNTAIKSVISGLAMLEHRGYDSIGLSCLTDQGVNTYKISKKEKEEFGASDLKNKIKDRDNKSNIAIGHNRWATFGGISKKNAHPHYDQEQKFYLVQNGNVENLKEVEAEIGEWARYSETDTEAIVNLIAKYYQENNSFLESVKKAINFIEGANAIVVMKVDEPDKLIAANKGGSIILAKNNNGILITSDLAAFEPFTIKKRKTLLDNEIAIISSLDWKIISSKKANKDNDKLTESLKNKEKFQHFMEQEIFEQPSTFLNTLRGRLIKTEGITHLDCTIDLARELRKVKTFHFVGCGTAYNACVYASLLLNRFGIASCAWIASEFCYSHPIFEANDAFVFISQSGETADTIEVIKEIDIKGNISLGIVNVVGSRIWRDTQAGIGIRAGKERGVASTKAYTSQLASIVILAVFLARQRGMMIDTGRKILTELESIPAKINQILLEAESIKKIAKKYKNFRDYYFLGRYFNSVTASEGSLKLKEISYVHAEAYPLGEMKHGPLALVDKNFCSVVITPNDSVFNKSLVNIHEIKAREGKVLAITNSDSKIKLADDFIYIPKTVDYLSPILSVIPLQLFSYYMALEFDKNPDKPRNLAKTVTVS